MIPALTHFSSFASASVTVSACVVAVAAPFASDDRARPFACVGRDCDSSDSEGEDDDDGVDFQRRRNKACCTGMLNSRRKKSPKECERSRSASRVVT